jgi:predicted AAA+ superfamily ATPase
MKQLQAQVETNGNPTLYFTADVEIGNDIFSSSKHFINFIKTQLGDKKLYIFIDEVQYIAEAGLFLK